MSIQYYQDNADIFFESTVQVDMSELYLSFLSRLAPNSLILDAGCGSGRDSKAFLDKGFRVEAFDASSEMVSRATKFTGLDVKKLHFDQVNDIDRYDAIWSCASLLHVPEDKLLESMRALAKSLKPEGFWYLSFKYGDRERYENGRQFTDMNESRFRNLVETLNTFEVMSLWLTPDKRPGRNNQWLNALLQKL